MENTSIEIMQTVDWSRAQFALTAIYHWLFVPLTLGLGIMCAIMETKYYRTGDISWKRTTQFWMRLFGVNFAIGIATGLILEFQFGTNWSNYSHFVGDIFGAPLAIEGIMAFFIEATFVAVMFFGWNKVSKKFHLFSTWMTAIGANLSALWILVANAWMQYPVGMEFNMDTARSEMVSFWAVLFSPVAMNKFLHTVTSSFVLASIFVIGISAWFLLKKRENLMACRSMKIASIFGLISFVFMLYSGDGASVQIAKIQPMKLAAMEGLQKGEKGADLTLIGPVKIPQLLSLLAYHDANAFVPGIQDLVEGNPEYDLMPVEEKMLKGRTAIRALAAYREAKTAGNTALMELEKQTFEANFPYFGYGFLHSPEDVIPNIPLLFYSFRIMVGLGFLFLFIFVYLWYVLWKKDPAKQRWFLYICLFSIPLAYIASQAGWVVSEVGRQPWTIQDLLPVSASISDLKSTSVKTTFILFAILFTVLLVAEIRILCKQIQIGPKDEK